MAHSCPECYQACYCGGDIDDILLDDQRHIQGCTHCSDLPDDDDDYEGIDEGIDEEYDYRESCE